LSKIKFKLQWKVFGFLLGFCMLLLIILWLFQIVFLNDFYRLVRITEIRNSASTIILHINDDNLQDVITALSENGDFTADVLFLDGQSAFRRSRPSQLDIALINMASKNGGEFYEYSSNLQNRVYEAQMPFRRFAPDPDENSQIRPEIYRRVYRPQPMESLLYIRLTGDRAVRINAVITPVIATVTTLRQQLYFISALMLILATVLAIIIAKHISKPIEKISHSALDLAKGRYDTRFSGKGFFEIEELSETLNTAAAELGKTESLRRELLANVSHDLRTPLALIYSNAEMMYDFPQDITKEQAKVIMDETRRLASLVSDVLDISKLEANMEHLNASSFNLTSCLYETIERLRELLKNQDYKIVFTHDADVTINADQTMINRAFYNLLINAINYAGADRIITVVQTVSQTRVRISVIDNGEGISEIDLPFIWDRYYKSGRPHKRAVTGTGLGLSIVKKIVELHEGEYGVISAIDKGSTFWFELNTSE